MHALYDRKAIVAALALVAGLAACNREHPAESAGRSIDQATEKAGQKMDEASRQLSREGDKVAAAVDDATITARVKSAILAEPDLKVLQIEVTTSKGVVTLSGSVDSQQLSERAKGLAAATANVKDVDNKLVVKSSG